MRTRPAALLPTASAVAPREAAAPQPKKTIVSHSSCDGMMRTSLLPRDDFSQDVISQRQDRAHQRVGGLLQIVSDLDEQVQLFEITRKGRDAGPGPAVGLVGLMFVRDRPVDGFQE